MFCVQLDRPGCADGSYEIHTPGYAHAVLYWANADGPLPNQMAFAHISLDESGAGRFTFSGSRAVPPDATHVAARLSALHQPEIIVLASLPAFAVRAGQPSVCIGVMSDLHLSSKPYRIRSAMRMLRNTDIVLLAGDLTNDGLPHQLEAFYRLVEEELPGIPVLAVTGNHDYPAHPLPLIRTGIDDYYALQEKLLSRASGLGISCLCDESGAYLARMNGCCFFGLNAVSHFRRFVFHEGRQLDWLEERLHTCTDAHKFVLCHAPLQKHNPNSPNGQIAPYLSRNARIQALVNASGPVCFISGHTHVSSNAPSGCVEYDADRKVLYLNDSSVTRTSLPPNEEDADPEWTDGTVTTISVRSTETEIAARAIPSGRLIPRGYYVFPW